MVRKSVVKQNARDEAFPAGALTYSKNLLVGK